MFSQPPYGQQSYGQPPYGQGQSSWGSIFGSQQRADPGTIELGLANAGLQPEVARNLARKAVVAQRVQQTLSNSGIDNELSAELAEDATESIVRNRPIQRPYDDYRQPVLGGKRRRRTRRRKQRGGYSTSTFSSNAASFSGGRRRRRSHKKHVKRSRRR